MDENMNDKVKSTIDALQSLGFIYKDKTYVKTIDNQEFEITISMPNKTLA